MNQHDAHLIQRDAERAADLVAMIAERIELTPAHDRTATLVDAARRAIQELQAEIRRSA